MEINPVTTALIVSLIGFVLTITPLWLALMGVRISNFWIEEARFGMKLYFISALIIVVAYSMKFVYKLFH